MHRRWWVPPTWTAGPTSCMSERSAAVAKAAGVAVAACAAVGLAWYVLGSSDASSAAAPKEAARVPVQAAAATPAVPSQASGGAAESPPTTAVASPAPTLRGVLTEQAQVLTGAVEAKSQPPSQPKEAKARRRKQPAQPAAPVPATEQAEEEPSAGSPFVTSVVNRAVLAQPSDLVSLAKPPTAERKGKDAGSPKKPTKKEKPKLLSSWAETFIAAVQVLESNTPDAAQQAHKMLDIALASAAKPGAPKEALPTTLRAIGFSFASIASLDQAAAAYARALAEARRRLPESACVLACWRDMAILRRERGEHDQAEVSAPAPARATTPTAPPPRAASRYHAPASTLVRARPRIAAGASRAS